MKHTLDFAKKGITCNESIYSKISFLVDKNDNFLHEQEKPVFLIVLLDKSGSMAMPAVKNDYKQSKLDYAKKATEDLMDYLSEKDLFALISFDHKVTMDQEPIETTNNNKSNIKKCINEIHTGGSTNISEALILGNKIITKELSDKYNCKILLLSDGEANYGLTAPHDFTMLVSKIVENNVSISTMGFGNDYDLNIMEAIAGNSGGKFYHISIIETVVDIFQQELKTARKVISKNVKAIISASKGYKINENLNKYNQKNINDAVCVELGNLYNNKYIHFEIETNNAKEDCLLTVEFYSNNELIEVKKEIIPLLTKEEFNSIPENKELLKEVIELIKANYVVTSSHMYSKGNISSISSNTLETTNKLTSIASTYSNIQSCVTDSLDTVTNLNTKYVTNAFTEDENRNLYSVSASIRKNNN